MDVLFPQKIGKYWYVAAKDNDKRYLQTYRTFICAAIQYHKLLKQR